MTSARVGSLVVSILVVGCTSSSEGPPPPIGAGTSMPSSTASPPGSSPAVRATEPPAFPVPATPPGADPEKVLFASSVCAAAYRSDGAVGCRAPPPFDLPGRQPDGELLLHTDDPLRFCELRRIYRGSFTRPSAKQAVLSFEQCKDPDESTWDSGSPGSAVLVEEIGGRWRTIAHEREVNTGSCEQSHRADGRDVLLCRSSFSAGGIGTMTYFVLLDFARGPKHAGTFAWLFADADNFNCLGLPPSGPAAPSGLVALAVTKVTLADINGDGTPDLVVDVERARAAPSAALEARIRTLCEQNMNRGLGRRAPPDDPEPQMLKIDRALPTATKARLELVSDGVSFGPSPASRSLLEAWEAESPGVIQLKGAAPPPLTR